MKPIVLCWIVLVAFTFCTGDLVSQNKPAKQPAGKKFQHSASCPADCATCKTALDKALKYLSTVDYRTAKKLSSQVVVPLSLAGLAFMAEGSTPSQGTYAKQVAKCVDDVFHFQTISKQYTANIHWGMAASALFLVEVQRKDPGEKIKELLKELAQEIQAGQEKDGAWAHGKKVNVPYRSLCAATVINLEALIQLKQAGFDVRDDAVSKGMQYLTRATNAAGAVTYDAANPKTNYSSPGLTAMALCNAVHRGDDPDKKWAGYLKKDVKNTLHLAHASFHLCLFYSALGSYVMGDEYWQNYRKEFLDRLLATQNESGASQYIPEDTPDLSKHAFKNNWEMGGSNQIGVGADDTYRTAILAMILQFHHEKLGLFASRKK